MMDRNYRVFMRNKKKQSRTPSRALMIYNTEIKQAMEATDSSKDILLCFNSYAKFKVGEELLKLNEWRIEESLYLTRTNDSLVLQKISQISFPTLKFIKLSQNKITSVEPFVRMNAPNLDQIWLWGNLIVNVRSFRKARFPHFKSNCI